MKNFQLGAADTLSFDKREQNPIHKNIRGKKRFQYSRTNDSRNDIFPAVSGAITKKIRADVGGVPVWESG